MPRKIAINTETLRSQADQIETYTAALEDDLLRATRQILIINESTSFSMRMAMAARTSLLQVMVNSLMETMQTGVTLIRQCADEFENADIQSKRNMDQILRDNIVDCPPSVTSVPVSTQGVMDETLYDQYRPEYMRDPAHPEKGGIFDPDGDTVSQGCALCSAAYALSSMGIHTTPTQAYERSGGMSAHWGPISGGQATYHNAGALSRESFDELARQFKENDNMSGLILHTTEFSSADAPNQGSHYIVLKDIELDDNGNISKYIVYDPNGYRAYHDRNGYTYSESDHIKVYSSYNELFSANKGPYSSVSLTDIAYYTRNE